MRMLYVDHVEARGRDFFRVACAHDLEGIVGKLAHAPYLTHPPLARWITVRVVTPMRL
jgi:ATP-dependent DNA ligase